MADARRERALHGAGGVGAPARAARRAVARARPRRRRRAGRSRARARRRGRRRDAARRRATRRVRRDRPLPGRARHRPRRRRRRRWRSRTSGSRGCSSTSTSRASELVRLARGLTPAKLARVVGMLDPVELMMALKKLRARRDPGNQAHVTNLKESPALLAADAAEAARRGFDELETTVGVARYAPLERARAPRRLADRPAGRDDAVRGRGAAEPRARDPRPRHLRRDALGLRHRAGVRRRRRHALVEGVPRVGVRVARGQGALHVGHRLRGADGPRRRAVDALPRGAVRLGRARGRRAGRPERVDLVRRARALGAGRDARDPRRERARGVARPRGRLRQRRDRLALARSARRRS